MTDSTPAALPDVTVTPRDNGPYRIAGPITLLDAEGRAYPVPAGRPLFLCRCGHSETKPFCDGTHTRIGFSSVVRAPGAEDEEPAGG